MNEFTLECDEANDEERKAESDRVVSGRRLDMKAVMRTPEGVRVLSRILTLTHLHKTSLSPSGSYETIRLEGERNIGLRLLQEMREADVSLAMDVLSKTLEE